MSALCSICEKVFSSLANHNRHVREVHKMDVKLCYGKDTNWNSRCLEPNCDSAFTTNKRLIEHLERIHSIKFETESFSLDDMDDFNHWKSEMELANNFSYVLKSRRASTTGEVTYFKCNRSNNGHNIKPMEERHRRLKRQGSCKLNSSCTSEIKIIVTNSKILLEWQKVHYGHSIELHHIRLPKIEKQKIVTKLVNGVTTQRILETTRGQIGEDLKRVDLLTSKDVRNIKKNLTYDLSIRDDTDFSVEEADISEELSVLPKEPQLVNERILSIKAMAAKFESFNFKELDDDTISKIHYHLKIATSLTNFPNISAVNSKFEIKNRSSKRPSEPETRSTARSTSAKRKRVATSPKKAENFQKNVSRTTGDSFIYESALNDHQYYFKR